MCEPESLQLPKWVPPHIGTLAQTLYAEAVARPPDFFGKHAIALCRVATDQRMREVWTEIYRQRGGGRRKATMSIPHSPK